MELREIRAEHVTWSFDEMNQYLQNFYITTLQKLLGLSPRSLSLGSPFHLLTSQYQPGSAAWRSAQAARHCHLPRHGEGRRPRLEPSVRPPARDQDYEAATKKGLESLELIRSSGDKRGGPWFFGV